DDPFADEFEESASTTELTVINDSNINEGLVSSVDAGETSLTSSSASDSVQLSLLFETNQDQLSYEMLDRVDDVAETIKAEPNSLIRIDGYADARGSEAYNQDLSYRRAQSVANHLIEQGVDRDRIIVRSMGESQSLAANDEYSYAQDRKVELSLDRSLTASHKSACEDASGAIDGNCESINQTDKLGHNLAELDDQLAQES
ncbi:MAG: OmpA family protein, partial [Emcibacteraceae bacterium]|nr:OmpA family protein [Emcibacteraceae bacterium]